MKIDQTKNEGKFKLAGDVSEKKSSNSKQLNLQSSLKRARLTSLILAILLLVAVGGIITLYLNLNVQVKQNQSIPNLKTELSTAQDKVAEYKVLLDSIQKEVIRLQLANELLTENYEPPQGTFFEIQLDGFRDFSLEQYQENLANLREETYDDKSQYLLGRFKSYQKAVAFERDLRRIGVKKSIIVGRIDDKIVTLKEALASTAEDNN